MWWSLRLNRFSFSQGRQGGEKETTVEKYALYVVIQSWTRKTGKCESKNKPLALLQRKNNKDIPNLVKIKATGILTKK